MAELAIPLIALGGLYIASNRNNDNQEGYSNITTKNELPNINPPLIVENYPKTKDVNSRENVKYYSNPNQVTDEYFHQNTFEKVEVNNPEYSVGGSVVPQLSLTGDEIKKSDFKHNNMVPFLVVKLKEQQVILTLEKVR